jgi:hypothetical protein
LATSAKSPRLDNCDGGEKNAAVLRWGNAHRWKFYGCYRPISSVRNLRLTFSGSDRWLIAGHRSSRVFPSEESAEEQLVLRDSNPDLNIQTQFTRWLSCKHEYISSLTGSKTYGSLPHFVRVPETKSPKNCCLQQRSGLIFVGLWRLV